MKWEGMGQVGKQEKRYAPDEIWIVDLWIFGTESWFGFVSKEVRSRPLNGVLIGLFVWLIGCCFAVGRSGWNVIIKTYYDRRRRERESKE
jgi:hypothetical protein